MSESKHTPGPWTVGRIQRSSNFAKDTYAVQGDGTILCRVKGGVTEDAQQALANACLIAAAPDGFEANREAADFIRAYFGPIASDDPAGWFDADALAVYRKLQAALAKAQGAPL